METTKEAFLALRAPLCRAEIAASMLERETLGGARRLVETIRAAISEADDRIELLARDLFATRTRRQRRHEVAALFDNVVGRVLPSLAARGVGVRCVRSDPAARTDSPELFRRCLIALLRFGAEQRADTAFAVGWVLGDPRSEAEESSGEASRADERLGVKLEFDSDRACCDASLAELRLFADRERVDLEVSRSEHATEVVAWLPTISQEVR